MLRILRRLTFTLMDEQGQPDGILQFGKLRSVFDAAHYSGQYYQNRALFADHYLNTRLREDAAWAADPGAAFRAVGPIASRARAHTGGQGESVIRAALYEPLWEALGFKWELGKQSNDGQPTADYRLCDGRGAPRTVALTYCWERWLDGPDPSDADTPDENPGAAVVTLLERGDADWVIVTNGKLWRLYSKAAHSRSTNFYEVDLEDVLVASGQSDPNEAFRYWWLFFRREAFEPAAGQTEGCWLDKIAKGSREYAREVEEKLKPRVFYQIVPMLAAGFLEDRRTRLKLKATPSAAELEEIRAATLALLYRILFLLYAESRDLLPVRETGYYQISLKRLKEQISAAAGIAETDADARLADAYTRRSTDLYERLQTLFAVMDSGDAAANVPIYNGGLFRTNPDAVDVADERERAIARFLRDHSVPDFFLASAIDRLARVEDPKGDPAFALAFIDYKSLGVRQLGSIYEGLLEFKLVIADEDLPPASETGKRKATSLASARGRRRTVDAGVEKGEPYLANDRSERKATGSYYTPDHIVQYIVEHTVGPVLHKKLEALRPGFREAEKTYHKQLANAKADPRICWDWKLKTGRSIASTKKPPTEQELRHYASDFTYEKHKDLVEKLFDLKVLDPSMGSGHFLVEAVDFITDDLLHFLNSFPVNPVAVALGRTRRGILESLAEQKIEVSELTERQLTDVHLLKRHVLKRCVYGVDLNPLATELAKVSLWLDAFTLGAPLSFLDHHLRTGNSLIGSSVLELDSVLSNGLFPTDYEPMRKAIQHVLFVARLADATAAEAHQSAQTYLAARQALAGYRIVLDAYTGQHFGAKLLQAIRLTGTQLKLENRESFFQTLDPRHAKLVQEVEELAALRRFFHWDLEFPEAFYQFKAGAFDTPDAILKTKASQALERKTDGEAGFDAIVGNPPYVAAWLGLDDHRFAQRVGTLVGSRQTEKTGELGRIRASAQQSRRDLLCRQLEEEKLLESVVEDAYNLTPEERQLLRETRPVRDPLDVLEAKIAGKAAADPENVEE